MGNSNKIVSEKEFREHLRWLILLRWMVIVGVFIAITVADRLITPNLPLVPLYAGNAILFLYNLLIHIYYSRNEIEHGGEGWFRKNNRLANWQVALDLMFLTYFIHFSGNIENPFILYYVFYIVVASILLSKRAAYLQALAAVFYLGIIGFAEYYGVVPHYHLSGYLPEDICLLNLSNLLGILFVLMTIVFLIVYITTSIVDRLRTQERQCIIANTKLEEQDRLKSQYVMTVSHDLQESLSAIQSCLKIVLSNLTGSMSEKAREMVGRAEQRSRYLLYFVRDLLSLSRIRAAGEVAKDKVIIKDVVKRVIEQLNGKVTDKNIRLDLDAFQDTTVWANADLIEHVFLNLISNAIKYTPQNGSIHISNQAYNDSNMVQVSVADTGIGIPEDALSHVFEDFYRAENARILVKAGTGLGLSIAKQIVEAHKGKIWIDSKMGKGSTVSFTLSKV